MCEGQLKLFGLSYHIWNRGDIYLSLFKISSNVRCYILSTYDLSQKATKVASALHTYSFWIWFCFVRIYDVDISENNVYSLLQFRRWWVLYNLHIFWIFLTKNCCSFCYFLNFLNIVLCVTLWLYKKLD